MTDAEPKETNDRFAGWDHCISQDGEHIYYLGSQGIIRWSSQLGPNLVLEESGIGGMVIEDTWLYYFKTDERKIRRIKPDEDDSSEIVFDAEMVDSAEPLEQICGFTLYNEKLYIKDTAISCFLYDAKAGRLLRLNDDIASGVFFDNQFFYTEHSQRSFSFFATDLMTFQTELIRGDAGTYNPEEPNKDILYS